MKIGFSSFVLQGGRTGIAVYIIKLLEALQRVDLSNDYRIFVNSDEAHLLPAPSTHQQHCLSAAPLVKPLPNIVWHNTVLPYLMYKEELDLVHIPTLRRLPFVHKGKLVATIHDLSTLKISKKYGTARYLYHQHVLTRLLPMCDRLITVSHYTKQDLLDYTDIPADRIHVIHSGIDHQLYRPRRPDSCRERLREEFGIDKPFITYVSRIEHPAKNHMTLIRAFEQLKRRHPNGLQLVLAGADWNGASVVHDYVAQSSVCDSIHFLGFVSTETVVDLYNATECMVFPSYLEGFGFPVLEAMACGAPVACSNTSAMRELAEGRAVLFDPYSIDETASAIEKALDRNFRCRAQEEGPLYASQFNWDNSAKEVLKVYQKALD
ncbi:MAG: glycosyltransferase family 4 protein [Chlamydiia bacterium]|nr:glycosyltransferase family 4 protein [Chlamydiia bacterium]